MSPTEHLELTITDWAPAVCFSQASCMRTLCSPFETQLRSHLLHESFPAVTPKEREDPCPL